MENLSLKWNFFYPMFGNCIDIKRCSFTFLKVDFFHQIVTLLPYKATEIVVFLKTNEVLVFLKKIDGLFQKKLEFFESR